MSSQGLGSGVPTIMHRTEAAGCVICPELRKQSGDEAFRLAASGPPVTPRSARLRAADRRNPSRCSHGRPMSAAQATCSPRPQGAAVDMDGTCATFDRFATSSSLRLASRLSSATPMPSISLRLGAQHTTRRRDRRPLAQRWREDILLVSAREARWRFLTALWLRASMTLRMTRCTCERTPTLGQTSK